MTLKELIDKKTDEIVVYGSRREVDVAMSVFDKNHEYELVKENATGDELVFHRKSAKHVEAMEGQSNG